MRLLEPGFSESFLGRHVFICLIILFYALGENVFVGFQIAVMGCDCTVSIQRVVSSAPKDATEEKHELKNGKVADLAAIEVREDQDYLKWLVNDDSLQVVHPNPVHRMHTQSIKRMNSVKLRDIASSSEKNRFTSICNL